MQVLPPHLLMTWGQRRRGLVEPPARQIGARGRRFMRSSPILPASRSCRATAIPVAARPTARARSSGYEASSPWSRARLMTPAAATTRARS